VLRLLPATASCMNLVQKNQFPELNRQILAINCIVWNNILSTGGDALRYLICSRKRKGGVTL